MNIQIINMKRKAAAQAAMRGIFTVVLAAAMFSGLTGCGGFDTQNRSESEVSETSETSEVPSASRDIFAMDTYMTVTTYGADAEAAADAAEAEITRLEKLLSAEIETSDVYRINHEGSAEVSEDTAAVIKEALILNDDTDGAFDMTVYPVMAAWGFTSGDYKVLTDDEISSLLTLVNSDYVVLDESTNTVTVTNEGTEIDLGGIAKGYTSAKLMALFKQYDLECALVNLGGNVQSYGTKTDGSSWRVAVQNPQDEASYLGVVAAADKAVITSGGYERYFEKDGITYHHIIDPATGSSANNGLISVTIVSENGTLADGLSTSLFIMGRDRAATYWEAHKELFDMILMDDTGNIFVSEGLADSFTSDQTFEVIK